MKKRDLFIIMVAGFIGGAIGGYLTAVIVEVLK